jgi:hypothetical protein
MKKRWSLSCIIITKQFLGNKVLIVLIHRKTTFSEAKRKLASVARTKQMRKIYVGGRYIN